MDEKDFLTKLMFNGQISDESKRFIKKKQIKAFVIFSSIIALIGEIILGFIFIPLALHMGVVYLLFLIIPILFIFIGLLLGLYLKIYPETIEIDDKWIYITSNTSNKNAMDCRMHLDIKKVVDMGNFYYFVFCFPHQYQYCLCQKDLLSRGSIEEFEKLFNDYM